MKNFIFILLTFISVSAFANECYINNDEEDDNIFITMCKDNKKLILIKEEFKGDKRVMLRETEFSVKNKKRIKSYRLYDVSYFNIEYKYSNYEHYLVEYVVFYWNNNTDMILLIPNASITQTDFWKKTCGSYNDDIPIYTMNIIDGSKVLKEKLRMIFADEDVFIWDEKEWNKIKKNGEPVNTIFTKTNIDNLYYLDMMKKVKSILDK